MLVRAWSLDSIVRNRPQPTACGAACPLPRVVSAGGVALDQSPQPKGRHRRHQGHEHVAKRNGIEQLQNNRQRRDEKPHALQQLAENTHRKKFFQNGVFQRLQTIVRIACAPASYCNKQLDCCGC